jgi:hypothetical protein
MGNPVTYDYYAAIDAGNTASTPVTPAKVANLTLISIRFPATVTGTSFTLQQRGDDGVWRTAFNTFGTALPPITPPAGGGVVVIDAAGLGIQLRKTLRLVSNATEAAKRDFMFSYAVV